MTQKTHRTTTGDPAARAAQPARSRRAQHHETRLKEARTRRLRRWLLGAAALAFAGLIGYGLWSAAPTSGDVSTTATDFTLPTTDGGSVTLSALRGKPVILYFNEGAGCGSCTAQMAAIEQDPDFAKAGITVLPIVMNTAEQILPDMQAFGVTTPYLLDDGEVSAAYDVLGKGMHEGLPGHGFVLIDADGNQVWYGNYPSMWLEPADLLNEVTSRLG